MRYSLGMRDVVRMGVGALLVGLVGLTGCGVSSGGGAGSSSFGSASPFGGTGVTDRATTNGQVAMVPVTIALRAVAPPDGELALDVAKVELVGEQTVALATRVELAKNEILPFKAGPKGATLLIAKTQVPKRKYTALNLDLTPDKSTVAVHGKAMPLRLASSQVKFAEWTPEENKANVLVVSVDGGKVSVTGNNAALPAGALTASTAQPGGAINGKVAPILPTASVSAFLGDSKVPLASGYPKAQDGGFAFSNLPAGSYRIEVRAPGYHLVEPLKDLVTVDGKGVTLKAIQLAPDMPR